MIRPATPVDTVMPGSPGDEHVLDETGHVHFDDAPIDLSIYPFEAWLAFGFFWLCALCVFYQFFTRYFMNDSASWTEEIARYLLICTVFLGIAAAVRMNRHIHVDFLYRVIPPRVGRMLEIFVDACEVVFFGAAVVLTWQLMGKMASYRMTIIDLPMNIVYGICLFGFLAGTVRAAQVMWIAWRTGDDVGDGRADRSGPDAAA